MQLPKELTTVTPLSKAIALIMFTLLPIIAFLLGMQFQQKLTKDVPSVEIEQQACTMDAKVCPDGSTVGRTGPNCEFSACPDSNASEAETFSGVVTDLIYDCHFDGVCSIMVDDKNIVTEEGGLRPPDGIQNKVGSLIGIDMNGDNEDKFIGKEVVVYARKLGSNSYTIYGDTSYYIALAEEGPILFCGGITGKLCPRGLYCQYEGNYPDAGGTCIRSPRNDDPSQPNPTN